MKCLMLRFLAGFLACCLFLGPDLTRRAWAQDDAGAASDEDIQTIQKLAKAGYLGDKKEAYLSGKTLTDEDVTNALIAVDANILKVDLKALKPGDKRYDLGDLKSLLQLVKEREEEIRAQKVSAWIFEHRLQRMITALTPPQAVATPTAEPTPAALASSEKPSASPTPAATPVPGPNRDEWNEMKDTIKELVKRAGELQDKYEKKLGEVEAGHKEVKTAYGESQEQLKLVQRLLDHIQNDQKKMEDNLDNVAKKANDKNITDADLQRELVVMHKDLRDNSQDVSILKQQVEKLNDPQKDPASPLDDALGSKWLAGGALLVGVTALVVAFTRK